MIMHLRRNAVAYLALFVALGGTSYAAVALPKNSVGAKQIKPNAVNAKKVKDGSLVAKDFKKGQLPAGARGPAGPVFGTVKNGSNVTLRPNPTGSDDLSHTFTLPSAGPTYLSFWTQDRRLTCSVGNPFMGLYVDGVPVPGSGTSLNVAETDPLPVSTAAIVQLSAGQHTVIVRNDCPLGLEINGFASSRYILSAFLLGSAG